MRTRLALGAAGVVLALFGAFRLVTEIPTSDLTALAIWLVAAVAIHDGVLSPAVVAVGWLVARVVPPRARGVLQGALVVAVGVTVVALPLIRREGTQPRSKAILQQNYGVNLAVLLGVVAGAALVVYAVRVAREHGGATDVTDDGPAAPS